MVVESYDHDLSSLLPHSGRMILLDRITHADERSIEADISVHPGNPFFETGRGIAAHIAIEWMAQACGAFVGLEGKRLNQPVRIGFLLGTRNFKATRSWFHPGENLAVRAELVYRDGATGMFDCTVRGTVSVEAQARLTLYQPEDLPTILANQGISMTGLG